MIKIENVEVIGWEHAIRGMRNPKNSWDRSDSEFTTQGDNGGTDCPCDCPLDIPAIGENDLKLMTVLGNAGTDHRKYMRMITVYLDITAPLYWYKEFDTYKVGTVANSCSTMHKIHDKEFTVDDFSYEHLDLTSFIFIETLIGGLNENRQKFIETKDKKYWWQMIQLLPSSYNQKRTVTMNYENALNMIEYRSSHKLDEWCEFVEALKKLPYIKELIE